MADELDVTVDDGIGVLTIDRPDKLNALTVEVAAALGAAAEQAVADGARAIVLTGRGSTFCAGADLSIVDKALAGEPHAALTPLVAGLHDSLVRMRALPVPIIAAIEGPAVGAGFGLALAADLRVMASGARFVPGYLAIGASPDGGVSFLLTRMVGSARAMSLILNNRPVKADEAVQLGLAENVVDDGTALAAARDVAGRLAGTAPLALVRVRELIDRAPEHGFTDHLALEQQRVTELWDTADFVEGVSAFVQRRKPEFRGE
ncbi:MAG TPA: enoyl-CoA hydratase-related protein [Jatrophihabitantaceae bacterium]|nr:enoyl-CoA hydratase-related protein [Jatrophihabitantaceae bacterium]